MSENRISGKTLYWVEAPDKVGHPEWRENPDDGFGALLARGFFLATPDSSFEDGLEEIPIVVEVDGGSYDLDKVEEITTGLATRGIEIIRVNEDFTPEPFDLMFILALLDDHFPF